MGKNENTIGRVGSSENFAVLVRVTGLGLTKMWYFRKELE